jgi:hypothetical protein
LQQKNRLPANFRVTSQMPGKKLDLSGAFGYYYFE